MQHAVTQLKNINKGELLEIKSLPRPQRGGASTARGPNSPNLF
jgi:hypothetical protein